MEAAEYEVMAAVEGSHWWYSGMRAISAAWLDRALPAQGLMQILDAGCGSGGNAEFLVRYGQSCGLDVARRALTLAARRIPGRLAGGSVLALPFADNSFDLVTSFDVLYHRAVADEHMALRETRRVLRPGGWLLLRLPAYQWLLSKHDRAVHTRRRYTAGEVAELVRGSSFSVERISYINSLLFPLPLIQRMLERLGGERAPGNSDLELPPAPVNRLLRTALELEAAWLRRGRAFAWGLSVLCLARKAGA